jgi:hypothetical protein
LNTKSKLGIDLSKILNLAVITLIFMPSAFIYAGEHLTYPDYSGSYIEYREYLSAEDLYKVCQGMHISYPITLKSYDDYSESIESRKFLKKYLTDFCTGYIVAAVEAYDNWKAKGGWIFCLRSNVSNSQIREIVNVYIDMHDVHANKIAVSVIAAALSERYACNQENNKRDRVYLTANELLIECKAANKGFCAGYIQGIIDAYDNWETKSGERFCGVGYGLWFSTLQLYKTLCEIYNVEDRYALEIVTASVKQTCDVSIERGLGCRNPARCEVK